SRVDTMTVTAADSNSCLTLPAAPAGLNALSGSSGQIGLNWSASSAPAGCSVISYSVFRSTTPGFSASGANQIASGLTGAAYTDSMALCGTTYYYLVEAVDSAGASAASNQASAATNACGPAGAVLINAGGPAVNPFSADIDFAGGSTINHANIIDLSKVTNPAPTPVYQTARVGSFTYTIPGFNPGSLHTVRLHFAETYFSTTGSRTFNVSINGATVLTNFDINAAAGGKNIAIVREFTQSASSTGDYVITFTSIINQSLVSAIEVQ